METQWSTLRSTNHTAGQSILRELVPEAELMSALSLNSIAFNFARIAGPSIVGLLILWIGIGVCLIFYAACLFISALALIGINLMSRAPAARGDSLFNEFKEGVRYIGATPMILASTVAAYVISIFVGTLPVFWPWSLKIFSKWVRTVWVCSSPRQGSARCYR